MMPRALLLLICACGAWGFSHLAAAATPDSSVPLAHPLGVVQVGEETHFDLTYTNRGQVDQVIGHVRSDCSCASILEHPARVAPGETVTLPVAYHAERTGLIGVHIQLAADAESTPWASFKLGGVVAEKSWLVSPEALGTPPFTDAVIIDLRASDAYARSRAPRSLSMQGHAIKSRADLRKHRLVLMDDGVDAVSPLLLAAELRSNGFDEVYVLKGGFATWLRSSRSVDGLPASAVEASLITPAEFTRVQETQPWRVLQIGPRAEVSSPFPVSLGAPVSVSGIDEALRQLGGDPQPASVRWLVIADKPNDYSYLERLLPAEVRRQVRYLSGGMPAWTAYARQRQARTGEHREIRISGAVPSGAGGCRSCP